MAKKTTSQQPQADPEVLTPEEARQKSRSGRNAFYEAIKRGEVPSIRIGKKILIPRARYEAMLRGEFIGSQTKTGQEVRR